MPSFVHAKLVITCDRLRGKRNEQSIGVSLFRSPAPRPSLVGWLLDSRSDGCDVTGKIRLRRGPLVIVRSGKRRRRRVARRAGGLNTGAVMRLRNRASTVPVFFRTPAPATAPNGRHRPRGFLPLRPLLHRAAPRGHRRRDGRLGLRTPSLYRLFFTAGSSHGGFDCRCAPAGL
jgi:hypothetical protein